MPPGCLFDDSDAHSDKAYNSSIMSDPVHREGGRVPHIRYDVYKSDTFPSFPSSPELFHGWHESVLRVIAHSNFDPKRVADYLYLSLPNKEQKLLDMELASRGFNIKTPGGESFILDILERNYGEQSHETLIRTRNAMNSVKIRQNENLRDFVFRAKDLWARAMDAGDVTPQYTVVQTIMYAMFENRWTLVTSLATASGLTIGKIDFGQLESFIKSHFFSDWSRSGPSLGLSHNSSSFHFHAEGQQEHERSDSRNA